MTTVRNPLFPLAALLFFVSVMLACTGCVSTSKAVAIGYATGTDLAKTVHRLCGNTVPDGPCVAGALITTDEKTQFKAALVQAKAQLDLAAQAQQIGEDQAANGYLQQASSVLDFIQAQLAAKQAAKPPKPDKPAKVDAPAAPST